MFSNWLKNIVVSVGGRVIGALVIPLAAYVANKTHGAVIIDVKQATELGAGLLVYALTHKAVSSQINPGDAATGRVAEGIADAANPSIGGTIVKIPPKPL